jgi:hypothetical protein
MTGHYALKLYRPDTLHQYIARLSLQPCPDGVWMVILDPEDPEHPPMRLQNICTRYAVAYRQLDASRRFWLLRPGYAARYAWDNPFTFPKSRRLLLEVEETRFALALDGLGECVAVLPLGPHCPSLQVAISLDGPTKVITLYDEREIFHIFRQGIVADALLVARAAAQATGRAQAATAPVPVALSHRRPWLMRQQRRSSLRWFRRYGFVRPSWPEENEVDSDAFQHLDFFFELERIGVSFLTMEPAELAYLTCHRLRGGYTTDYKGCALEVGIERIELDDQRSSCVHPKVLRVQPQRLRPSHAAESTSSAKDDSAAASTRPAAAAAAGTRTAVPREPADARPSLSSGRVSAAEEALYPALYLSFELGAPYSGDVWNVRFGYVALQTIELCLEEGFVRAAWPFLQLLVANDVDEPEHAVTSDISTVPPASASEPGRQIYFEYLLVNPLTLRVSFFISPIASQSAEQDVPPYARSVPSVQLTPLNEIHGSLFRAGNATTGAGLEFDTPDANSPSTRDATQQQQQQQQQRAQPAPSHPASDGALVLAPERSSVETAPAGNRQASPERSRQHSRALDRGRDASDTFSASASAAVQHSLSRRIGSGTGALAGGHVLHTGSEQSVRLGGGGNRSVRGYRTILRPLLAALGTVEDVSLSARALLLEHYLDSVGHWLEFIQEFYLLQFRASQLQLLASSDLLGNPTRLLDSVAEGVSEIFETPRQATSSYDLLLRLSRANMGLFTNSVRGLFRTVSSVSASLSRGLTAMTGDSQYIQKREERRRDAPSSVAGGLRKGLVSFGYEMRTAVTGLVREPYRGAQAGSVSRGIRRALVQAVIRPANGFLDLIMHPAASLGARPHYQRLPAGRRVRPPRCFGPGLRLVPYCVEDAQGNDLLWRLLVRKATSSASDPYPNLEFYVGMVRVSASAIYEAAPPQSSTAAATRAFALERLPLGPRYGVVLVSTESIYGLVVHSERPSKFQCIWQVPWSEVVQVVESLPASPAVVKVLHSAAPSYHRFWQRIRNRYAMERVQRLSEELEKRQERVKATKAAATPATPRSAALARSQRSAAVQQLRIECASIAQRDELLQMLRQVFCTVARGRLLTSQASMAPPSPGCTFRLDAAGKRETESRPSTDALSIATGADQHERSTLYSSGSAKPRATNTNVSNFKSGLPPMASTSAPPLVRSGRVESEPDAPEPGSIAAGIADVMSSENAHGLSASSGRSDGESLSPVVRVSACATASVAGPERGVAAECSAQPPIETPTWYALDSSQPPLPLAESTGGMEVASGVVGVPVANTMGCVIENRSDTTFVLVWQYLDGGFFLQEAPPTIYAQSRAKFVIYRAAQPPKRRSPLRRQRQRQLEQHLPATSFESAAIATGAFAAPGAVRGSSEVAPDMPRSSDTALVPEQHLRARQVQRQRRRDQLGLRKLSGIILYALADPDDQQAIYDERRWVTLEFGVSRRAVPRAHVRCPPPMVSTLLFQRAASALQMLCVLEAMETPTKTDRSTASLPTSGALSSSAADAAGRASTSSERSLRWRKRSPAARRERLQNARIVASEAAVQSHHDAASVLSSTSSDSDDIDVERSVLESYEPSTIMGPPESHSMATRVAASDDPVLPAPASCEPEASRPRSRSHSRPGERLRSWLRRRGAAGASATVPSRLDKLANTQSAREGTATAGLSLTASQALTTAASPDCTALNYEKGVGEREPDLQRQCDRALQATAAVEETEADEANARAPEGCTIRVAAEVHSDSEDGYLDAPLALEDADPM